jgi:DNA-binding MarR family transcriptional regulator
MGARELSRDNSEKLTQGERDRLQQDLTREMQKLVAEVVLFNQAVADRLGINPTDLQCLNILSETGPIAAGRLAEATGLTTGAITGVIDRLERAGYAWRERDPNDKRRVIVHPLPEQVKREIEPLYEPMGQSFTEMCSRYDEGGLALILDFIIRSHPLNREETAKLRGSYPGRRDEDSEFATPLGSVTSGHLVFERGISKVMVGADPSMGELFRARFDDPPPRVQTREGTVAIRQRKRRLQFLDQKEHVGEIMLNASVPWGIEVRGGASGLAADLDRLKLRSLEIKGGGSEIELKLPPPSGDVQVRFFGGISDCTIRRPTSVALRIRVSGGASKLAFDGQHIGATGDEIRLQSPGYDGADDRYDVEVLGGASNFTIGIT